MYRTTYIVIYLAVHASSLHAQECEFLKRPGSGSIDHPVVDANQTPRLSVDRCSTCVANDYKRASDEVTEKRRIQSEAKACDTNKCQPAFTAEVAKCLRQNTVPIPELPGKVQIRPGRQSSLNTCSNQAIQKSLRCYIQCEAGAKRRAVPP